MRLLSPEPSWFATGDRLIRAEHPPGAPPPRYLLHRRYLVPLAVIAAFGVGGWVFMLVNLAIDPSWEPMVRGNREPVAGGLIASSLLILIAVALVPILAWRDRRDRTDSMPSAVLTPAAVLATVRIGDRRLLPWDSIVSMAATGSGKVLLLTRSGGGTARIYCSTAGEAAVIRGYWERPQERSRIGSEESRRRMTAA